MGYQNDPSIKCRSKIKAYTIVTELEVLLYKSVPNIYLIIYRVLAKLEITVCLMKYICFKNKIYQQQQIFQIVCMLQ
jgi:hypothetical protein